MMKQLLTLSLSLGLVTCLTPRAEAWVASYDQDGTVISYHLAQEQVVIQQYQPWSELTLPGSAPFLEGTKSIILPFTDLKERMKTPADRTHEGLLADAETLRGQIEYLKKFGTPETLTFAQQRLVALSEEISQHATSYDAYVKLMAWISDKNPVNVSAKDTPDALKRLGEAHIIEQWEVWVSKTPVAMAKILLTREKGSTPKVLNFDWSVGKCQLTLAAYREGHETAQLEFNFNGKRVSIAKDFVAEEPLSNKSGQVMHAFQQKVFAYECF